MTYSLRSGLSFCIVEGRPVFLDLFADRYFMLSGDSEVQFCSLLIGGEIEADAVSRLLRKRIVQNNGGEPRPLVACAAPPAMDDLQYNEDASANGLVTTQLLLRHSRAISALKRGSLHPVLSRYRDIKSRAHRQNENQAPDILASAKRAARLSSRLLGSNDRCLSLSIAVAGWLGARHIFPDLIIGVRIPFAAHCWLQWKGTVVTDSVDRVSDYTPILVI